MLSQQELCELALILTTYKKQEETLYIWVTGLSGSGKTFVVRELSERLQPFGTLAVLSDLDELLYVLRDDSRGIYYTITEQGFIVTHSKVFDLVLSRLIGLIQSSEEDYLLIELARGDDIFDKVDMSYRCFSNHLTEEILHRSVFVYLSCPFEKRVTRNSQRPSQGKHRRVDPFAFERYFQKDDFAEWAAKINAPILTLEN